MTKQHHKPKKINYRPLIMILMIVFLVVSAYNLYLTQDIKKMFLQDVKPATKEAVKLAEIEVVAITPGECQDCFDLSELLTAIKGSNINVTEEKTLDSLTLEAKNLIKKYGIEKLPTLIITGDLDKTAQTSVFEEKEGALILKEVGLPYVDVASGEVKGRISVISLEDSSCEECSTLELFIESMKAQGIAITEQKTIDIGSLKAQDIIKKYNITKVPAIILSEDAALYPKIQEAWSAIGSYEEDGSLVQRDVVPPYRDLETDEIKGLVTITYVVDQDCEECYNASIHKSLLERFGLEIVEEKELDIASDEGKELVETYDITEIPTIILSPSAGDYVYFLQVWDSVGTIEGDGYFIFRNNEIMQLPYKDLATGDVISPSPAEIVE